MRKLEKQEKRYEIRLSEKKVTVEINGKTVEKTVPVILKFKKPVGTKTKGIIRWGSLGAKAVHEGRFSHTLQELKDLRKLSDSEFESKILQYQKDCNAMNEEIVYSGFLSVFCDTRGPEPRYWVGGGLTFRSPYSGRKVTVDAGDYAIGDEFFKENLAYAQETDTPEFLTKTPDGKPKGGDVKDEVDDDIDIDDEGEEKGDNDEV